ncbi:MAG: phosphoglycerate dehydrogenase [Deltaproteobacteria bacterium]|nr:phosphoglycerate dehydrogenase [Deltaproteobacteria bacterium]MBW2497504.1 phosphoglycerate dehydrogenase [Deltaproteobacteria bacterium]
MPRILVSDSLADQGLAVLEQAAGLEVVNKPGCSPDELLALVADVDGLVIRSGTKVTEDVLKAAPRLRVVGRAGIGVDNVDVSAATARGVVVVNTPEGNNITTAEHAIALMVSLARHIPQATASMKAGKWEKKKFQGMELYNRTLGVLGAGNIGRFVVSRAKGLGMNVIVHDPYLTAEAAARLEVERVTFEEMMSRADVVTVHVPKTKETTGIVGREAFALARPGLFVINAARGGIVDEEALLEALDSGQVGGAGLDVFVEEPPPAGHPLVSHPNVICTPHLGASTEQAQINVSVAVAEQVRDFLLKGIVRNAINVPSVAPEQMAEIQPYLTLAEKLGAFQGQLAQGRVDQVEVEYAGEIAELKVAPITIAVLKGILSPVKEGVNLVNAAHVAQEMGIKVIESKVGRATDFASAITVRVRGTVERLVAGSVFHGDQPRIVRIDDFMLEAIPEGCTLLIHNHDQAGVVGNVGTLLGDAGINISRMQLALNEARGEACMLVNINRDPGEKVLAALRDAPSMIAVQLVEL